MLDECGVKCHFLGYTGGRGNYKVQGAESCWVFVSRDMIFEEGQPHRTSPIVGKNIPLFDVITPNDSEANNRDSKRDDLHNHHENLNNHYDNLDPGDQDHDQVDHVDIPVAIKQITEPRRSA